MCREQQALPCQHHSIRRVEESRYKNTHIFNQISKIWVMLWCGAHLRASRGAAQPGNLWPGRGRWCRGRPWCVEGGRPEVPPSLVTCDQDEGGDAGGVPGVWRVGVQRYRPT